MAENNVPTVVVDGTPVRLNVASANVVYRAKKKNLSLSLLMIINEPKVNHTYIRDIGDHIIVSFSRDN